MDSNIQDTISLYRGYYRSCRDIVLHPNRSLEVAIQEHLPIILDQLENHLIAR